MRRLATRISLTHAAVALLTAAITFAVVRLLAPTLFDQSLHGLGGGKRRPAWAGTLREQMAADVGWALLVGAGIAAVVAIGLGFWFGRHLVKPLNGVRAATRRLAQGEFRVEVPMPAEQELADVAADVRKLGEELAASESRRVQLLGEVAHELRTPLTVIDGTVEAMIDGLVPITAESLAAISAEVRRMRRLAHDLSALSAAEEGRIPITLAPVDLRECVEDAVSRLRPQAEDAGLELSPASATEAVPVLGDVDRLSQVVMNLVGNAIRATPAGGRIQVAVSRTDALAEVRVTDTGIGLVKADLERIFERFYRVTSNHPGSGIGLTIARQLMRAQGGDLVAASQGLGHGATFTASMPVHHE